MQKKNALTDILFVVVSVFAALVSLGAYVLTRSTATQLIFYALAVSGVFLIYKKSFAVRRYSLFALKKNMFRLDVFALVAALGFFLQFVVHTIGFFRLAGASPLNVPALFTAAFSSLLSVASSGYFVMASLSCSGRYDFKSLGVLHIVPILWGITTAFRLMSETDGFSGSVSGFLRYLTVIMLLLFIYRFVCEAEAQSRVRALTVFFAGCYCYFSLLFLVNCLMLIIAGRARVLTYDNSLALSCFMISGFVLLFEKNAEYNNTTDSEL